MNVRLNKFIADAGVASRRKADELIESGKVQVNGKKVYELGVKVNPHVDQVSVEGRVIRVEKQKMYLAFFKPKGVLTTMSDPEGRPTVAEYFENIPVRLFPVGRLDWDSEGLLIMTNDGDFANKVLHPKEEIPKTYLVKVKGHPAEADLEKLKSGVSIPGGRVRARQIEKVRRGDARDKSWFRITITEGKNRQLRYMFEKVGFDVEKIQRIAIGQLTIGSLERGEYTFLSREAVAKVFMKDAPKKERPKSFKKSPTTPTRTPVVSRRPR